MIPNSPGIEVGIWAEGEHLIVVASRDAVSGGISVATGDAPNLTTNKGSGLPVSVGNWLKGG